MGPGVKTRLPPAYVASKSFVSLFNFKATPAPMWAAAFATSAVVSTE